MTLLHRLHTPLGGWLIALLTTLAVWGLMVTTALASFTPPPPTLTLRKATLLSQ